MEPSSGTKEGLCYRVFNPVMKTLSNDAYRLFSSSEYVYKLVVQEENTVCSFVYGCNVESIETETA